MVLFKLILDEFKVSFPSTCKISDFDGGATEDVFPSTCKMLDLVGEETEHVFPLSWKIFGLVLRYFGACSASEQLSSVSSLTMGQNGWILGLNTVAGFSG